VLSNRFYKSLFLNDQVAVLLPRLSVRPLHSGRRLLLLPPLTFRLAVSFYTRYQRYPMTFCLPRHGDRTDTRIILIH